MGFNESLPLIIATATGTLLLVIFILIVIFLPSFSLLIINWKFLLLLLFGFITYKVYQESKNIFGQMPQ